jgi:hypothetical protein
MFRNLASINIHSGPAVFIIFTMLSLCFACGKNQPEVPRIDFVELSIKQPQENDPDVI